MHTLFTDNTAFSNGIFTVSGEDAHHIGFSLRMKCGEKLNVACGGEVHRCVIKSITSDAVILQSELILPSPEIPSSVILYQSLTKGDSFEGIIRRAVECGVSAIVPIISDHCIAKIGDNVEKKLVRYSKIAKEAAMQSGRAIVPPVMPPVYFDRMTEMMKNHDLSLICHEGEGTEKIGRIIAGNPCAGTIGIAVGPEGGFSEQEIKKASGCNIIPCGLGKRILRAETASSFALACITYKLELE